MKPKTKQCKYCHKPIIDKDDWHGEYYCVAPVKQATEDSWDLGRFEDRNYSVGEVIELIVKEKFALSQYKKELIKKIRKLAKKWGKGTIDGERIVPIDQVIKEIKEGVREVSI